jgi:hypothetical protein
LLRDDHAITIFWLFCWSAESLVEGVFSNSRYQPDIARRGNTMSSASYVLILIFLGAGCTLGWFANRSVSAHGDVKSTKRKLPGYRKTRHRNGIVALILAFVIAFAVLDLIHPHH